MPAKKIDKQDVLNDRELASVRGGAPRSGISHEPVTLEIWAPGDGSDVKPKKPGFIDHDLDLNE